MNNLLSLIGKIKIHPLFWVILGLSFITAQMVQVSIIFLLVFLHELGHASVATYFKWRIKKIELLPFGGVMETDEFGARSVKEENLVLLGGPVVHIIMLILYFIAQFFIPLHDEFASFFVKANISLLLFNLLPIFPLDGGRLVLNGLSLFYPYIQALKNTLLLSIAMLGIVTSAVVLFSPGNLPFWMVFLFLSVTLYLEWKNKSVTFIRFLLAQYYGSKQTMHSLKKIYASQDDFLFSVFTKFYRSCKHLIVVEHKRYGNQSYDENELYYTFFTEKNTSATMSDLYVGYK